MTGDANLCLGAQGVAREAVLLRKGGMRPGQALVLTKALGVGTLLAAAMRMQADGRSVQGEPLTLTRSSARNKHADSNPSVHIQTTDGVFSCMEGGLPRRLVKDQESERLCGCSPVTEHAERQGHGAAGAVDSMQQSSAAASEVLRAHGATACTDVTGFGLLGHLGEMTRASAVRTIVG